MKEFSSVLFDAIEKTLKNSELENLIPELYEGFNNIFALHLLLFYYFPRKLY